MYRVLLCPIILVVVGLALPSEARAQWARTGRPIQRLDRWLGLGNGDGYHWRNPGPDSSYYNTWSEHNSAMVSGFGPPPYGSPTGYQPRSNYAPQDFAPTWNSGNSGRVAPGIPTLAIRNPESNPPQPANMDTSWNQHQLSGNIKLATFPENGGLTPPIQSTGSRSMRKSWTEPPPIESGRQVITR